MQFQKIEITRTLCDQLKNILTDSSKSILILGPRQVGKSTLCKTFSANLSLNLARNSTFIDMQKDPQLLERQVNALPVGSLICIDEVQRLPDILNTIQFLIDESVNKPVFLLTGSSARKLKKQGANLLPGRLFSLKLFPFTYWELQQHFSLETALNIGTLPEVYLSKIGTELLQQYVDIYLKEEIQFDSLARNLASFAKFLDAAASLSGKEINYSTCAVEIEIPKETLRRYFEILEDTLIVHRISCYPLSKCENFRSRKVSQKDKFLFFDIGVRNSLLRRVNQEKTPEEIGELFEQWIGLQLIAHNSYSKNSHKIYYYRDDKQLEVDWVVDLGTCLIAIEVKNSQKTKSSHFENLKSFCKIAQKPVLPYLVFRGETAEKWQDIQAMPWQIFLANWPQILLDGAKKATNI